MGTILVHLQVASGMIGFMRGFLLMCVWLYAAIGQLRCC
jgi:hypothetical protein